VQCSEAAAPDGVDIRFALDKGVDHVQVPVLRSSVERGLVEAGRAQLYVRAALELRDQGADVPFLRGQVQARQLHLES
jgi:hypothetical protein